MWLQNKDIISKAATEAQIHKHQNDFVDMKEVLLSNILINTVQEVQII